MNLFKSVGLPLNSVGPVLFAGCLTAIMASAPANGQMWMGPPQTFGPVTQTPAANQGASSSTPDGGFEKQKGNSKLGNSDSRREEAKIRKEEAKLEKLERQERKEESKLRREESKLGNLDSRREPQMGSGKPSAMQQNQAIQQNQAMRQSQAVQQMNKQTQQMQQMNQQVMPNGLGTAKSR